MSQNENKNAAARGLTVCLFRATPPHPTPSYPIPHQTPFACQAMDSLLGFYLQTVLPTALAEVTRETRNLMPHVESIQQIFNILKSDVNACVSLSDTLGELGGSGM